MLTKTFAVTVVVGVLLNAINQGDALSKDPKTVVLWKVALAMGRKASFFQLTTRARGRRLAAAINLGTCAQ